MRPSNLFALVRKLGPRRSIWRAGHEVWGKLRGEVRVAPLRGVEALPGHASWLEQLGQACWPAVVAARTGGVGVREDHEEDLIAKADAAASGQMCLFDHMVVSGPWPPQWHWHPLERVRWPLWPAGRVLGWGGDIKGIWEMDRQAHVALWLRAAAAGGDRVRYGQALREHMESFLAQNPPGLGAHWASGQEHALRWMMWAGGVAGLWQECSAAEMVPFWRATWIHGHMIAKGIGFARFASPNNHLVCEVAVLWVIGHSVQDFWPLEAARWKRLARGIWEREGRQLFYEDGGFCQGSMNYQRFALEMLVWWRVHLGEKDPIREEIRQICQRSLKVYLMAMTSGGEVPNLGANDGAMLWRWTRCAHEDYRPLVQTLGVLAGGKKPLPPGPWDEALAWWFGRDEFPTGSPPPLPPVFLAPASGMVWWRHGEDRVSLRTGPLSGTASQEDVGQVSVWLGGEAVVVDAGSLSYRGAEHRWHAGPKAHNGPTVGGRGATRRLTRFHVAMDAQVRVFVKHEKAEMCWQRGGTQVTRGVGQVRGGKWRVCDEVWARTQEEVVWGWTLGGRGWRAMGGGVWVDEGARGGGSDLSACRGAGYRAGSVGGDTLPAAAACHAGGVPV